MNIYDQICSIPNEPSIWRPNTPHEMIIGTITDNAAPGYNHVITRDDNLKIVIGFEIPIDEMQNLMSNSTITIVCAVIGYQGAVLPSTYLKYGILNHELYQYYEATKYIMK